MPVKEEMTFSSSMSKEDFLKWLKSKGVDETVCDTLSSKIIIIIIYYYLSLCIISYAILQI